MSYRFSILIAAPPVRVFDLFMDLDRMREWVGGVTQATDRTGPVDQVGTRYTVWFGRMRSPTEILAVERPRHVRTRFGNLILIGESDVRLEPESGGTRLTQEFHTRGVVSAMAARLFATGSYKGSFRGELEAFRESPNERSPPRSPARPPPEPGTEGGQVGIAARTGASG